MPRLTQESSSCRNSGSERSPAPVPPGRCGHRVRRGPGPRSWIRRSAVSSSPPAAAPPGQHGERVAVELLGQHVADRGQVLARHLPVRAAAPHVQIAGRTREQRRAAWPGQRLARNSAWLASLSCTARHCAVVRRLLIEVTFGT